MNPFNWQGQPSVLAKGLKLLETRKRVAAAALANPTDRREFHQYQKATPSEQPRNPQA